MTQEKGNDYQEEATFLHEQMFGRNPSAFLLEGYMAAHQNIPELLHIEPEQKRSIQKIISKHLAVVGIEPWLRTKGRRHPITSKLLLIAYLAECDATHPEFDRDSNSNITGFLWIMIHGIKGVAILIRGRLQMIWHGIN